MKHIPCKGLNKEYRATYMILFLVATTWDQWRNGGCLGNDTSIGFSNLHVISTSPL
jgi:hypothetical protein